MSATLIQNPLPGEDMTGIEPQLLEQLNAQSGLSWLHRLNLFTGRALTAASLQSEQAYRAGRLATLGQLVTQGTVKGLELSADFSKADPVLQVAPGYGICATGEDVALTRGLQTTLGSLTVINPAGGADISTFPNYTANPANTTYAGVLLLQPITAQANGASLNTGALPQIVSGNLGASCNQDPEEYAFEDWQIVDGVRLVMVAWPSTPTTLSLPAAAPAASYRNRLVYTVFNAELALTPDDRLPWDMLGVPLALIAFDSTWKPLFIDCSSVVRTGGLARSRYVLPALPGAPSTPLLVEPALAQARVTQLAEQINASPGLNSLVPSFALLPPCGLLPASSVDFTKHVAQWLPALWTVNAAPVFLEEVETALLGSMTAQPLDVTQAETVDLLVPLPDAVYDPDVLITETLDPSFQTAVNNATSELAGALQHRKTIQEEANALAQALTGTSQTPPYDLSAGLTAAEIALRDAAVYTPTSSETFGTTSTSNGYVSNDLQNLISAANGPYTITVDGNGNKLNPPLALFSAADMADMTTNGIQHFIDRMNNKLNKANDLLDLAFLTAQSDIYRFRQYVLGATAATALAVSPIAAEIATGESASSTAANLQNYLSSILPARTTTASTVPATTALRLLRINVTQTAATLAATRPISVSSAVSPTVFKATTTAARAAISPVNLVSSAAIAKTFVPAAPGSVAQPASTADVTSDSPLVGAQLNLRTLTIAQRLANPPSQEGLFYSIGNRIALLNLLAALEITIDDIPILVDSPPPPPAPAAATTTTPSPGAAASNPNPTMAALRAGADTNYKAAVFTAVESPLIATPSGSDPDEASLFSTGIHVLEQHSSLLRAVEARVAQYNDFITLCSTALSNIQVDLPQAETLLSQQLDNAMAQGRQDLAFTTALLNDEEQRIATVNAQRAYTLANYVQAVAFMRPRTLQTNANAPSRQLVPGNVASPVPACLAQQPAAIPPELREIVALLREAPVSWMPSVSAQMNKLALPGLLGDFAADIQNRAAMVLAQPARVSFAAADTTLYAPLIAKLYSTNQQSFTPIVKQRAAFQPASIAALSWTSQLTTLQNFAAVGDLIASPNVHAEIVNATARLVQQVSSVATCLFSRANQALPIDRLAWAEFLTGAGLNIQLQSLAVLPNWNTQDYVSRQQMQMLVDWLFLQIDSTNNAAVSFMSDVVRLAILLASDAPADNVVAGAVTLATAPAVGGIVNLTLPSIRISAGMYVSLYSSGVLAAQAVVSDLDSSSVRATVTKVYKPGVSLQSNDVAHFSAQPPVAVATRAFDM